MGSLVTRYAPEFTAHVVMPNNSIEEKTLSQLRRGRYALLFFYPLDFTFVCPSEILAFDKALDEFHRRNCEIIGVSVDSQYTHLAWKNTPRDKGGIGNISFPLVSDLSKKIADSYGILLDMGVALRGLFLIDKEGVVRHETINDLPLGRNVEEALRMLDALQFVEENGGVPGQLEERRERHGPTQNGVAAYLSKLT